MSVGEIISICVLGFMLLFSLYAAAYNVSIVARRLWCLLRGIEAHRPSMIMIVTALVGAASLSGFGEMNRFSPRVFYQWADNWWWLPIPIDVVITGVGFLMLHERR